MEDNAITEQKMPLQFIAINNKLKQLINKWRQSMNQQMPKTCQQMVQNVKHAENAFTICVALKNTKALNAQVPRG